MKKAVVIINPIAGSGTGLHLLGLAQSSPLASNIELELLVTEGPGHAAQLANEALARGVDTLVAAGGDGTVNEVASRLVHTTARLGIIPLGSGNGLARQLGWSVNPEIALKQLLYSETLKIDTLVLNGRFGVNVSGLGMDGYVAWRFNHEGHRGLSNYTRIALQEFFRYPSVRYTIRCGQDEVVTRNAHMCVIANSPEFGNKALIAPRALLSDGLMDIVFVKRPPLHRLPGIMLRLFRGNLKDNAWIETLQTKQLSIQTDRPIHLHIDGESLPPTDSLDVRLLPGSLLVAKPGPAQP
jgi:YegS/Rv2252/BmrU family lipid kinase